MKLDALTGSRAIAALMIVIFHYGSGFFPFNLCGNFFTLGFLSVKYFFVLSGFVMYFSYYNREISYLNFIKRRVARIAPLYYFALLLVVAPIFFVWLKNGVFMEPDFINKFLLHAFFAQVYVPGYVMTLNNPAWSLAVEMMFYAFFPLLLSLQIRSEKRFAIGSVIFWVVISFVFFGLLHYYRANKDYAFWILFHPVMHFSQFLFGMMGAALFVKLKERKYWWSNSLLYFALYLVCINYLNDYIDFDKGLMAPLFMMLVISIAHNRPKILNNRIMVYLGDISYGIYILQKPMHNLAITINNKYLHLSKANLFYLFLVILIVVSAIAYHLIEKPIQRKINSFKIRESYSRLIKKQAS